MITSSIVQRCPKCNSEDICRNGHDYKGAQKYHCHRCKSYGTLNARQGYREEEKELIVRTYQERASMRGVERIFGTARQTLARWIREKAAKLPAMETTLLAAEPDDLLELDELWSFVRTKRNQRWLWIALCRRTRQVVAYFSGDRSASSCRRLRQLIPKAIAPVAPAATSGKRINWPLMPQRTAPWARKQAKPPMSNAGITPCDNAWLDLFAKRSLFPSPTTFTNWPCSCSSMTTTCSAYQSICNHYQKFVIGQA